MKYVALYCVVACLTMFSVACVGIEGAPNRPGGSSSDNLSPGDPRETSPPGNPSVPGNATQLCKDWVKGGCQSDADCSSDKPFCSNPFQIPPGTQSFRVCLPCQGNVMPDGTSSSCKPTSVWTTYGGDVCQSQGMKLLEMVPCLSCSGDSYTYVLYACVATSCAAP